MAMNSAQFVDVVEPLLNDVFVDEYDRLEQEWSKIFKVEKALPRRQQYAVMARTLGVAQEKSEGAPVAYDNGAGEAWKTSFVPRTFALAFSMSKELQEDSEYLSLGKDMAEALAGAMVEAKEIFHANIFSNATNGAAPYVLGDGVSLLNTAHPLSGGGSFSNTTAAPADLSETSLEQIRLQVRLAVNERGIPVGLKPTRLIVHPSNLMNATRILKSTLRVGTNNNDINALNLLGVIPEIMELTRLTAPHAWFVQTNAKKGFVHKWRVKMDKAMEGCFENDDMRYKARERYDAKAVDPRCVYGSIGT